MLEQERERERVRERERERESVCACECLYECRGYLHLDELAKLLVYDSVTSTM